MASDGSSMRGCICMLPPPSEQVALRCCRCAELTVKLVHRCCLGRVVVNCYRFDNWLCDLITGYWLKMVYRLCIVSWVFPRSEQSSLILSIHFLGPPLGWFPITVPILTDIRIPFSSFLVHVAHKAKVQSPCVCQPYNIHFINNFSTLYIRPHYISCLPL